MSVVVNGRVFSVNTVHEIVSLWLEMMRQEAR